VSHLLCDQLEFADLLLVNKCDLVSEAQIGAVETLLRKVNPTAEVVRTEHSKLPPATLLEARRASACRRPRSTRSGWWRRASTNAIQANGSDLGTTFAYI